MQARTSACGLHRCRMQTKKLLYVVDVILVVILFYSLAAIALLE